MNNLAATRRRMLISKSLVYDPNVESSRLPHEQDFSRQGRSINGIAPQSVKLAFQQTFHFLKIC